MAEPRLRLRALGTENMRRDNLVRCGEVGHMGGPNDRINRTKHVVYIPLGKYVAERVVCVLIVFKLTCAISVGACSH